jgi:Rhodopirellula transposase DDE domain
MHAQMLLGVWEALTLLGGYIVDMQNSTRESQQPLRPSQIADLRLAASKMTGPTRRAWQAEMALQYCGGPPLRAATLFGGGRHPVEVGLAERRTGILCLGAQAAFSGRKRWEDTQPEAAAALCRLAEAHAQQEPTFRTTLASTRLTAQAALETLRVQGSGADQLPSPSTMAEVLHRMGFRLRKVVKAKPQKQLAATDAICENIEKKTQRRQRTMANA